MAARLTGKVAIVTGASSGIGAAVARRLAAEGWPVGLVARRLDCLQEVADAIRSSGGSAAVAAADVGDRDQVRAAFAAIRADLGPIELMVANAGIGVPTHLDPVNVGDVEEMVRVNFLGVVYAIEAAVPDMLSRGRGHLAAVSSLAAFKGLPGESGYCATKAAVNTYLEGLRVHLRVRGIRVTTLCPGFVRTPMTASNAFHMPWLVEADDAARKIVAALRNGWKVYRFPWQLSLLMRLVAWLPDWIIARVMRDYCDNLSHQSDRALTAVIPG